MHAILNEYLPLWGITEYENRRVICAAFPYLLPDSCYAGRNIARFAVVEDYHKICGARLEQVCAALRPLYPGSAFACHCDNTRLPEVTLAEQAGLGVRGRHNLLITPNYGSWVFLGEIVTTANLPAVSCAQQSSPCVRCAAPCVLRCPANCLAPPGLGRCLSRVSQRKGERAPEEIALLRQAGSAWGCDICQEACPCNARAAIAPLPEFLRLPLPHVSAETPLAGRAYAWRGEQIKKNIARLFP
ncbi:MAG: DUF1730 domain-containing protein [Oscillospiraceae bacterium]|jgi:epoxyqueuosine reductase|nr:DUF1730 domain-containing protein [Oscillospiraceae bacterium]